MTDTTDIAALMRDMRDLADRIIDAEGENNNGEVGRIIDMYDAADTTFKAENILLVLNAFEAERQRADDEKAINKHLDLAIRQSEGVNANLRRSAEKAEAELSAMEGVALALRDEVRKLKGDQVPVAWRHDSDILCHKVVTMSEVVAKSWIDKGRSVTPLYDRTQKPVVLPQAFAVRSGHPFNEGDRTAMIPDDKGNWLSKFDVEHAIKMAGGIVKDGE